MHICIFEDYSVDNFYPLTISRPVYELICGIKTLREKILCFFPGAEYTLFCRKYLEETVKQNNPGIEVNNLGDDNYIFINGRVLIDDNFLLAYRDNGNSNYGTFVIYDETGDTQTALADFSNSAVGFNRYNVGACSGRRKYFNVRVDGRCNDDWYCGQ